MSTAPPKTHPYLNDAKTQLTGSGLQHSNCGCTVTAALVDVSTLEVWKPTPDQVRANTGDFSGGVSYTDLANAAKKASISGGEAVLTVLYFAPETPTDSTLRSLAKAPRVGGVSILCSVTHDTIFHTGDYMGRHCVEYGGDFYETRKRPDGTPYQFHGAYVMDPGKGAAYVEWAEWPFSLLVKAARASTETSDSIHVFYTRDLGGVSRKAHAAGSLRSAPRADAPVVGSTVKDSTYTVVTTARGGNYSANGHTANGWSELGSNKYAHGGLVR